MEIIWRIPCPERALDRIEELEEAVNNFPESPLRPIWEKEIESLRESNYLSPAGGKERTE
jgi:hypothetical protein